MNHDAQAVLDFWFGVPGSPEHGSDRPEWFRKDAGFDARIRERFGTLISAVLGGARFGAAPQETLAAIVVLDQFTRNVHRDTPLAFAGDAQALGLAQEGDLLGRACAAEDLVAVREAAETADHVAVPDRVVEPVAHRGRARRECLEAAHRTVLQRRILGMFEWQVDEAALQHGQAVVGAARRHRLGEPGSRF